MAAAKKPHTGKVRLPPTLKQRDGPEGAGQLC